MQALDGERFVEIEARPVPVMGGPLPQGEARALGHLVLRRDGDVVTLRDGLRDTEIGRLEVPGDFEVARFAPVGRLLVFATWDDGGDRSTATVRAFDSRTGELLLSTTGGVRAAPDVSPDGVILVQADAEDVEGTRAWVAATKGDR